MFPILNLLVIQAWGLPLSAPVRSKIVRYLLLHWCPDAIALEVLCSLNTVYNVQENLFIWGSSCRPTFRPEEAVDLGEQVLKASKRILGDEHPDTLGSMINLAISYSDLDRRQEAVNLQEQMLKASKRILGAEHPETLLSMHNLAVSYSDLDRRQEVLDLVEQVLETSKRVLDDQHPDTVLCFDKLTYLSFNQSLKRKRGLN